MLKLAVYSHERGLRWLRSPEYFSKYKEALPSAIKVKIPSKKSLKKWISTGVAKSVDGCSVEPDGVCPHGYPSWLIVLGYL